MCTPLLKSLATGLNHITILHEDKELVLYVVTTLVQYSIFSL